MKSKIHLFILITIIISFIVGLINPNGIRTAVINNSWSLSFLRDYVQGDLMDLQDYSSPPKHRHAGLLLANQALKQDNLELAWAYLAPMVNAPDRLILETQANILFLQGQYDNAIHIWKDLGNYSRLYIAARSLTDEEHIDAIILAYRSAYELRGNPYDRLFISSSMYKADLHIEKGQINQAIPIYRTLISEFPDDARPFSGLVRAYWLNNQPDQALSVIELGWENNMENPSYYITAAHYYEEFGLKEKALRTYQTLLEIDPANQEALGGIERLLGANE